MNPCPKCGGPMKEEAKFPGLLTCLDTKSCNGMELTPTGARDFYATCFRMVGEMHGVTVTYDQIIRGWNAAHPGDEW